MIYLKYLLKSSFQYILNNKDTKKPMWAVDSMAVCHVLEQRCGLQSGLVLKVVCARICVYLDCLESLSALDSFCQAAALPAWET